MREHKIPHKSCFTGLCSVLNFILISAKLANQFDNGVFRDLFGEHAFYTIVALAIYVWLAYQIFKGVESNRFRIGMASTLIILAVSVGLLYFHPYLTNWYTFRKLTSLFTCSMKHSNLISAMQTNMS